jgi:hypothetical protein
MSCLENKATKLPHFHTTETCSTLIYFRVDFKHELFLHYTLGTCQIQKVA